MDNENKEIDSLLLKDTFTANIRKEYWTVLGRRRLTRYMLKNTANVRTAEFFYMRNKEKEIGKVMHTNTAKVYEIRYRQCDKGGD